MQNTLPEIDQELIFLINDDGSKKDEVLDEDYQAAINLMWADFFASPIGKIFKQNYNDDSLERVDSVYQSRYARETYGWKTILSHRMQAVVQTLHDAGDPGLVLKDSLKPRAATPAQPARPQDKETGRFLSDVEIEALSDLNGDTRQPDIDAKRRTRPDYRAAYDVAKFASMGIKVQRSTKPGIEWEPLQPAKQAVPDDLLKFARAWKKTPSQNLHADGYGYITLVDGSEYSAEQYTANLNAAIAAGAIV